MASAGGKTAGPIPVLLLGPPGSGKGTQARRLSASLGFPSISTGELLRHNSDPGIGERVRERMSKGLLIPDAVVNAIVAGRLQQPDCQRGFILDGYPRDVNQARYLDFALHRLNAQTPVLIHLLLPDPLVLERITHRLECPWCGETTAVNGTVDVRGLTCEADGAALLHRPDDNAVSVTTRLQVYHATAPELLRFYSGVRLLEVPAWDEVDRIASAVLAFVSDPAYCVL